MLQKEFIESLSEVLPTAEIDRFIASLDGQSPTSIRFNPYKIAEKPEGRGVPWCRYGYYLDERPQFTIDPLFHGGIYYVQEASSMFVEHLFREAVGDECAGLKVLDLCAAPGGKTTLLSTLVGLEGVVVANEVIRPRAMALADNVVKWGLGNVVVTNNDPSHFADLRDYFDVVLIDAPCSGEGMFRKNEEARSEWSPSAVELCAARQRRILSDIWRSVKPGGVVIYSTCTFNRAENEDNIKWLSEEFACEGIDVSIEPSWGIVKSNVECSDGSDIECFRFFPHKIEGEGFFATAVRKGEGKVRTKIPKPRRTPFTDLPKQSVKAVSQWVNAPDYMHFAQVNDNIYGYYSAVYPAIKTIVESLSVVHSGVVMGQLFSGKLKPDHSLALFHDLSAEAAPRADLELLEALQYLRKAEVNPIQMSEGMNLICYQSVPLGWIKRIGARANNLYPKELRILNL